MQQNKNINLAREFVHRLKNTCYSPTTIQLINAMAQNTNYENRMYYGGLLDLRWQTHLGRSTINTHLRILKADGLLKVTYGKNQLYTEHKRQNYSLILPPVGLLHCGEWETHNTNPHHLDSFQSCLTRLAEYQREEQRLADIQDANRPPQWGEISAIEQSVEEDYF